MGRGYSGNHPRYSGERYDAKEAYNKDLTASARLHYLENDRHDHESPAHMSVNQRINDSFGLGQNNDKTPSPMNSHCSPMHAHNRSHKLRQRAIKVSERSGAERGDEYDYENPKVQKLLSKARKVDERSSNEYNSEKRKREVDSMIDERADSPMNQGHSRGRALDSVKTNKHYFQKNRLLKKQLDKGQDERAGQTKMEIKNLMDNPDYSGYVNERAQYDLQEKQDFIDKSSPLDACAKSEGGKGCVQQISGSWRVISNKTDKPWPAKYANKAKAEAALRGYHAG